MPSQYLSGTPFAEWEPTTIQTAIDGQMTADSLLALSYYRGDHWQNGEGWGGPRPDPFTTSAADAALFMAKIEKLFTSSNAIGEVVDRHAGAIAGNEPGWNLVPVEPTDNDNDERDPDIVATEAALVDWFDRRNAHQEILNAVAQSVASGKAWVRVFVPLGLLDGGKIPSGLTAKDALDLIWIEGMGPLTAGTARNRHTMSEAAFCRWAEAVEEGGAVRETKRTEMQFVERRGTNAITVVKAWTDAELAGTLELDLGGHLMIHELALKPLVSPQLIQLQRGLNFALTAMGNNNANAGFLERIITNAQPPGSYEVDQKTGKREFVPSNRYPGGPGATVFLTGHPVRDEQGNITNYTTPNPVFRDPSSPDAFVSSAETYRGAIYLEAKQGHVTGQGDGNLSGASRIQMRSDFATSLRGTRLAVEDTYRWLLGTLLRLMGIFGAKGTPYGDWRPTVSANVDTGPLSDAERDALVVQYDKRIRSRESTQVLLGVNDPDAETQRIRAELPAIPVALDQLGALGITILPEHAAELMRRAGLEVTPEQEAAMASVYEQRQQALGAAAQARFRALNPQDDGNGAPTDAGG